MTRTSPFTVAALLFGAFLLFVVNIGHYDVWAPDEPRYAEVAREMMMTHDYITPHLNGQRYQEKPPLLFWCIAAVSQPFGDVNAFSARFPSVLAGVLTLLFTFLLARRLFDDRTALWALIVLATCSSFWWQARTGQIDMLLTCCTTLALLVFWLWHEQRRIWWLVAFYGAITAAVYAKGPPGYIFPLLMVLAFFWKQKQERRKAHLILGSVAVWGLFLIWYFAANAGHKPVEGAHELTALQNIYRNTIGRLMGISKFDPWPWSYVISMSVDLLPWTLFFPWAIPWVWRRRKDSVAMRLLLSWFVPGFVVFSILITKRSIYILPLYPVAAILIAASLIDLMDSDRVVWRKRSAVVWGIALLVLAGAPFLIRFTPYADLWSSDLVIFSLTALAFGLDTLRRARRTDCRALPAAIASHFCGLALLSALLIFPIVNQLKRSKDFCAPVRHMAERHDDVRVYSLAFLREEYIFYSHHNLTPALFDVVPLNVQPPVSPDKLASEERHMLREMVKAVAGVKIESFAHVTQGELDGLNKALENVIQEKKIKPDRVHAFEQAVDQEIAKFDKEFSAGGPAFAYVETENWRWMLALRPELARYRVLKDRQVASREMLLIANDDAVQLLKEKGKP